MKTPYFSHSTGRYSKTSGTQSSENRALFSARKQWKSHLRVITLAIYQIQSWHLVFISAVTAIESNIVIAFTTGFYQETRVCIFAADILFHEICYIQLIVSVIRQGTAFKSDRCIRGVTLQDSIFVVPIPSCIIPCNSFVSFVPANITFIPGRSRSVDLNYCL